MCGRDARAPSGGLWLSHSFLVIPVEAGAASGNSSVCSSSRCCSHLLASEEESIFSPSLAREHRRGTRRGGSFPPLLRPRLSCCCAGDMMRKAAWWVWWSNHRLHPAPKKERAGRPRSQRGRLAIPLLACHPGRGRNCVRELLRLHQLSLLQPPPRKRGGEHLLSLAREGVPTRHASGREFPSAASTSAVMLLKRGHYEQGGLAGWLVGPPS